MTMKTRADGNAAEVEAGSLQVAAGVEAGSLKVAACLFHGFSDPSRLAILQHLSLGEHRVVDLTTHLGLAQSTVSQHLTCLKDCGLVTSRPVGRASMFSLTHPEEMMSLFAVAEHLLDLSGDAVALCANHGTDRAASRHATTLGTRMLDGNPYAHR